MSVNFIKTLSNLPFGAVTLSTAACVLFAAAPWSPAAAHVRWFVEPDALDHQTIEAFQLGEPLVLIWIAIAAVMVAIAVALDMKLPKPPIAPSKIRHDVMELMRILTGMSLLLTAYDGGLIAPHLQASGVFGGALVFLQAVIGILLLSNHFLHHAALLLLLMYLGMFTQFGVVRTIEYVNFVGIALFTLFNYFPNEEMRARLKPYSVDMLRIFTGLSLMILGYFEKLHPQALGQVFLADHAWNFMPLIGLDWFDDRLFVLSAGVMEIVFGLILVLGVVTRLNILAVAGLMLCSNVVFILQQNRDAALMEFVGHLPIIATALILLLLGYGQRLKVTTLFAGAEGRGASRQEVGQ